MELQSSSLPPHVILVSFPGQGHVNPLLRLAKLLASKGLLITFVTTEAWGKKMKIINKIQERILKPVGKGYLRFDFFDDGLPEDDDASRADITILRPHLELVGKREIKNLVKRYEEVMKQPVTCLINNPFVSWVCDVAEDLQIPCAVLWVQSCACLASYYYYHHELVQFPTETEPEIDVQIPGLPLLKHDEIPSFIHPSTPYTALREVILDQIKRLHKTFSVLIDTFDSLEKDIIDHMSNLSPPGAIRPLGPLYKIAKTLTCDDTKGNISEPKDDCMEWLDSQPDSSVVYISFGTVAYVKQEQIDEIAFGVLNADVSFLWVIRQQELGFNKKRHVLPEEVKAKGKIVEWCSQEKVLAHPSVVCFVTHCGWNSTMEAVSSGVPTVCFPQWGDQVTDAVYMAEVLKTGVRLSRGEAEDRVVPREEVAEKLRKVTKGEKAIELKKNALKWKEEAEAAVSHGGSSDRNLDEFVQKLGAKPVAKRNASHNHVLTESITNFSTSH
ncbi:UDP-glycosyltransferase 84A2 [Cardamine amara subsp. amara]|uniref:Glycosyltransferase n=1 Tax=Cardamine amara subsp. amara TaxID=228776 RepID=A0ABD0ZS66_CARAN